MAYRLKSTGLAQYCTMCVAVDPDDAVIRSYTSGPIISTLGSAAVVATPWSGGTLSTRFFELSSTSPIRFGTKPTMIHTAAAPEITFLAAIRPEETGEQAAIISDGTISNYFSVANSQGGVGPNLVRNGSAHIGSTNITPSPTGNHETVIATTVEYNSSTITTYVRRSGTTLVSLLFGISGNMNTSVDSIGARNGASVYSRHDYYLVAMFNKVLSQSEVESFETDPVGVLLEQIPSGVTGACSPAGVTITAASGNGSASSGGVQGIGLVSEVIVIVPSGATGTVTNIVSATAAVGNIVLSTVSGIGTTVTIPGQLVSKVIKNNTGFIYANVTDYTINIYDPDTGELVLHATGLKSDSNGRISITSEALSAGIDYVYELKASNGKRRLPTVTAI